MSPNTKRVKELLLALGELQYIKNITPSEFVDNKLEESIEEEIISIVADLELQIELAEMQWSLEEDNYA